MFYNPELKEYLDLMKIEQVYYLALNSKSQDEGAVVYETNASAETGSFQHVHVHAIPTASLDFYSSK
jgi:histidinol-phosphatase (PHP family)